MKKNILLFLSLILMLNIENVVAQQDIQHAMRIGISIRDSLFNNYGSVPSGLNTGCAGMVLNPSWFYLPVCTPNMELEVRINGTQPALYDSLYFVVYGPLQDTLNAETQILTMSPAYCGKYLGLPIMPSYNFTPPSIGVYYLLIGTGYNNKNYYINVDCPSNPYNYNVTGPGCSICSGGVRNLEQDLCLITLDSATQRNELIWEKGDTTGIAGYYIRRENSIWNQFDSLTFVSRDSFSTYLDVTANPASHLWRYKISTMDVCGNYIENFSNPGSDYNRYTTLFLQQAVSSFNSINLNWTTTINTPPVPGNCCFVQSYFIYRGNSMNSMVLIDSVTSQVSAYTDLIPLPGVNYYQVAMRKNSPCSPSYRVTSNSILESKSNFIAALFTGVSENNANNVFSFYPNPATNIITLEMKESYSDYSVSILNVEGKIVFSKEKMNKKEMQIPLGNLATGMYFLEVKNSEGSFFKKLAIR